MVDPARLRSLAGRTVLIAFADGERTEARLVAVDTDEHRDVVYEVRRVIVPGPHTGYARERFYRAFIDEIESVEPVG